MSGKLNNYRGSGATALNTLATWSCTVFDATTSLSGFGTVLVTTSVDALGKTTSTWTDGAGRTLRSIDQLGKVTTMTYDPAGNQLSVRDPNNVGADMVYDFLGRNTQRTDTASAVTKTEYDKAGNAVKQIDAKNKNTFIVYDARGRRKSTTDRISAATVFTYTALGQLASLTDDQAQTTSYTYNSRGNKLTETYPDHTGGSPGDSTYGIVTFVYDNAGRVLRKQDQLGDTVTHTYDLAGRMTTRAYRTRVNSPSGTIADSDTFTFDRASRMLTAVNGRYTNTVTMTYDPIGRKATEGLTISGRTYTTTSEYNARGELTRLTYPDSSIAERTYHDTGALHLLKLDGSTISTRTYDDGRRLTGETLGNGVTETRTYSTDNLLSGISYGGTGTSIGNLSYTWDANKNKTSETIGGTMSGYGFTSAGTSYDDEDRLTGYARTNGTFTQSWNLTKVGDWTSVTTNGTAQNRTHGPTHELLTAGGQSLETDPKGNITLLPTVLSSSLTPQASRLIWDFDNKLRGADLGNNSSVDVNFQYDALGRRVARTGTGGSVVYVQYDQQTIADYPVGGVASTPTNRYVYASYIDEPVVRKAAGTGGTIHYYHRNQQYSITAMTTSTGAVAERYAYTAYGQPTILNASGSVLTSSAVGNRYTYTGREWDETLGLHHFRARWMSPMTGRFLGRDPIGYEDGMLLYEMLGTTPLNAMDPNGLSFIFPLPDPRFDPFMFPFGSPPSGCVDTQTGSKREAACTIPGRWWGTRTVRVPCDHGDYVSCCSSAYPSVIRFKGIITTYGTRTCTTTQSAFCLTEPIKSSPVKPPVCKCPTNVGPLVVVSLAMTLANKTQSGSVSRVEEELYGDWCGVYSCEGGSWEFEKTIGPDRDGITRIPDFQRTPIDTPDGKKWITCRLVRRYPGPCLGW
jgi:RHS repeat-associated protein